MGDISPIQIRQLQLVKTSRESREVCVIKQHVVNAESQLGLDVETILRSHSKASPNHNAAKVIRMTPKSQDFSANYLERSNSVATVDINESQFEALVTQSPIVFVDFWAEWCGPCKMFAPIFEAASEKHSDVVFAKVDTEVERSLAAAAGITSIPTLMVFRDGILLFRQPGALPAASLEELITAIKAADMEQIRKEVAAAENQASK
jgi:thioredoxin 1